MWPFGGRRNGKSAAEDESSDMVLSHTDFSAVPVHLPSFGGGKEVEVSPGKTGLQFSDETLTVEIEQPKEGFFCTVKVLGKVPLPPREVFDILTNPQNKSIFRSIKKVNYRKEVKDDGRGRKTIEVEHVGRWRFGPIKGEFVVRMNVHQDRNKSRIRFQLLDSSLMKDFSGEWTIEPYDEDALDELVRYPNKRWGPLHYVSKAVHRFEEQLTHTPTDSLVQLKQSVQPRLLPPPPLDRVLKQITLAQVRCIMQDLLGEVERINAEKKKRQIEDIAFSGGLKSKQNHGIFSFCKQLHNDDDRVVEKK